MMTVSVCMITYGHEKYIKEAIRGVLMQQADFAIELIIANDCSPDRTDEMVKEVLAHHPNRHWVRYTRHEQNKGMLPNFIWALQQCTGKYVALCEGDDYWIDPAKLQKQVSFLEENLDFAICYHRVYELLPNRRKMLAAINTADTDRTYTIDDLARGNFMHTPSVVFRNNLTGAFPYWFKDSPVGDYVLHMMNARYGKIKYLAEPMAVYRKHNGGVWSSLNKEHNYGRWLNMLDLLLKEDFSDPVLEWLNIQKKGCITDYLLVLLERDPSTFLQRLQEFSTLDPVLEKEWLYVHYPRLVHELRTSWLKRLKFRYPKGTDYVINAKRKYWPV